MGERYTVRRAVSADAALLAKLSLETFDETFGHIYAPEDLADYLGSAYPVQGYLDGLNELGYAAWLLEDAEGRAMGYAYAGPAMVTHAERQPGDMQLVRLYVYKAAQGQGSGGRLMDAAMAWMEASAPRNLWLGVWSENPGAQRFYARYGFSHDGDYLFPIGKSMDLEFIFRKRLG